MEDLRLTELGLDKKWPKLARLQQEVEGLARQLERARAEAQQHRAQLGPARERDLRAEAEALRAGKKMPDPVHEPKVQAELEEAERRAARLERALQSAREEYAASFAEHQREVFDAVLEARHEIAEELARHATAALRLFGRHEDLARQVKQLRPAPVVDEGAPARPLTNAFAGVMTTQRGPDRGHIEQVLTYLVGLGADQEGEDAA